MEIENQDKRREVLSKNLKAIIVVIGTEILKGIIQDTNSHWLSKQLTKIGIDVRRIIAVPDDPMEISDAVKQSLKLGDIVIVTGGLGFTDDDITLSSVANSLGLGLELNSEAMDMIRRRIGSRDIRQFIKAAYIPRGGKPLYNRVGISPGVYLSLDKKYIFILPGVPAEMKAIYRDHVEPMLQRLTGRYVRTITVLTNHMIEADVNEKINLLRQKYPSIYFKTHAEKPVRISITIEGKSVEEVMEKINLIKNELRKLISIKEIYLEE